MVIQYIVLGCCTVLFPLSIQMDDDDAFIYSEKRNSRCVFSLKIPLLMCQELCLCVNSFVCGMPELAHLYAYTTVPPPLNSVGLKITYPSPLPSSFLSSPARDLPALQILTDLIVIQDGGCVYVHSGRTLLVTQQFFQVTARSFTLHKPLIHFMPLFFTLRLVLLSPLVLASSQQLKYFHHYESIQESSSSQS